MFNRPVELVPGFSRFGSVLKCEDLQILLEHPLKAVQLACQYNLKPESEIFSTLQKLEIEPSLTREDLTQIMLSDFAARAIKMMSETGLLKKLLPELEACRGMEQFGGFHHLDVLEHSIEALMRLLATFPNATLETRMATLLHDIGKPAAKNWDVVRERWSFFAHDQIGAKVARALLNRLGYAEEFVVRVSKMVDRHMLRLPSDQTSASRFVRRNTEILPELLEVMLADREAARGLASDEQSRRSYQHGFELVLVALQENSSLKPIMNGQEVMNYLNLKPGKAVGQALKFLKTLQETGEITTLEQARNALTDWNNVRNLKLEIQ